MIVGGNKVPDIPKIVRVTGFIREQGEAQDYFENWLAMLSFMVFVNVYVLLEVRRDAEEEVTVDDVLSSRCRRSILIFLLWRLVSILHKYIFDSVLEITIKLG